MNLMKRMIQRYLSRVWNNGGIQVNRTNAKNKTFCAWIYNFKNSVQDLLLTITYSSLDVYFY